MTKPQIPVTEYAERVRRAAALVAEAKLDVMVANANEADYSNVRYLSNYWPLFEMGGVAVAPSGEAATLIGMECETYARGRSYIPNIHMLREYRETADPVYPGIEASSYKAAFESIGVKNPRRIGIAGYLCTNLAMYEGLRANFPDAELVNADHIMTKLRSIKSPAEIACLREGQMHLKTYEWMTAGTPAGEVARKYEAQVAKDGMKPYYLYGPCHGLGLIEVEKPWLESTSTYLLEPGMTFQADTFFCDKDFGLRWENALLVKPEDPAEMLSSGKRMEIIEIDC